MLDCLYLVLNVFTFGTVVHVPNAQLIQFVMLIALRSSDAFAFKAAGTFESGAVRSQ